MLIQVTKEKLDIEAATTAISNDAAGAVNIFLGIVRNNNKGREVSYLVYDAYPQMAEKEMYKIAKAAIEKFGLHDCSILHRTGKLEIGESKIIVYTQSFDQYLILCKPCRPSCI